MDINSGGSVINLRQRLQEMDRKKAQSDTDKTSDSSSVSSDSTSVSSDKNSAEKQYVTDIIGIRNENMLAVASYGRMMTNDEADETLDELKQQFAGDSQTALNAHDKADPNAVMQFYPFEL